MKESLKRIVSGQSLSEEETLEVFNKFLGKDDEAINDAQIAAYLTALASRLPTVDELVGAVRSMRAHMKAVDLTSDLPNVHFVDTCGTGGSGLDTFNTSTVSGLSLRARGSMLLSTGIALRPAEAEARIYSLHLASISMRVRRQLNAACGKPNSHFYLLPITTQQQSA